jgi:hypothetical protein
MKSLVAFVRRKLSESAARQAATDFREIASRADVERLRHLLQQSPELLDVVLHLPPGLERTSVLEVLLDHGLAPDSDRARNELLYSATTNDCPSIRLLVERGVATHGAGYEKKSPLHSAAEMWHPSAVTLLLELGADVNATSREGKTPLDVAATSTWKTYPYKANDGTTTMETLRRHGGVNGGGAAAARPALSPAEQARATCRHQFQWITARGLDCVVCHRPVSHELVSDDRGKHCSQCGLVIHVRCQSQ